MFESWQISAESLGLDQRWQIPGSSQLHSSPLDLTLEHLHCSETTCLKKEKESFPSSLIDCKWDWWQLHLWVFAPYQWAGKTTVPLPEVGRVWKDIHPANECWKDRCYMTECMSTVPTQCQVCPGPLIKSCVQGKYFQHLAVHLRQEVKAANVGSTVY